MNKGDKLYRVKRISGKREVVEILSSDPDNEYLIHVIDLLTGHAKFIHKVFLDTWLKVDNGIQEEMFREDKTEKFKKIFNG